MEKAAMEASRSKEGLWSRDLLAFLTFAAIGFLLLTASVDPVMAGSSRSVSQITVPVRQVAFHVIPEDEQIKEAVMSGLDASNHMLVKWGVSTSDTPDYALIWDVEFTRTELDDCVSNVHVKFGGFDERDYFEHYFTVNRVGGCKCADLPKKIRTLTETIMQDLIPAIAQGERPEVLDGELPEDDYYETNEFELSRAEAAEERRAATSAEWSSRLGTSIGCALGGGCPEASHRPPSPTKALTHRGCNSGLDCPIGQRCVKPQGSYDGGTCAEPVDRFGIREVSPTKIGVQEVPSCRFDIDCPIGFECSMQGGSIKGICTRR